MQLNLTLETIRRLDGGKVAIAFDHEIAQLVRDVTDRPGDKTARKAKLEVTAVPRLNEVDGSLDTIGLTFRVSSTTPVRRSLEYPMLGTNAGKLLFQEASPRDPRQTELPYTERVDDDEPRQEEVLDEDS